MTPRDTSHQPTPRPDRDAPSPALKLCGLLEQASRIATTLGRHELAAQLEASAGSVYRGPRPGTIAVLQPSESVEDYNRAAALVERGRAGKSAPDEPTRLEEWRGHDDQAEQGPRDFKLERAPSEFMPADRSSGYQDLEQAAARIAAGLASMDALIERARQLSCTIGQALTASRTPPPGPFQGGGSGR